MKYGWYLYLFVDRVVSIFLQVRVFLVMELCPNGDLQEAAQNSDNIMVDRKKWILQVKNYIITLYTSCARACECHVIIYMHA